MTHPVHTSIARPIVNDVIVRDRSLCRDLIGKVGFTEMMLLLVLGRVTPPNQTAVIEACMVALMEHGLTPTALAARLTYSAVPEALQGAVAAGLLSVGGTFAGTMEGCGALLARLVEAEDAAAEADRVVAEHRASRTPVPGFGHMQHKPDDPRALRLFEVVADQGCSGPHTAAIHTLSAALDAAVGHHVTINVTGAIAAALADCGIPHEIMRGFAVVSRAAGLVAHIHEEQRQSTLDVLWRAGEAAIPYVGGGDGDSP